jgi:NCAIR mutase (PurE)-related protein
MEEDRIIEILKGYKSDQISERDVIEYLKNLPFEDLSFAKIDHHRALRWGFPEVIFCHGKTPEQVKIIAERIIESGSNLFATRADDEIFRELLTVLPDARYNETAKTITYIKREIKKLPGRLIIVTAGTSDLPIATESLETANVLGLEAKILADVGVAGIHRLMNFSEELHAASVIIVVAGMEGALPSVVAGLVSSPVIAVPTSIGYGASFNGLTPLLSMLNSCVPGIAVVNIDNGFGAAFLAFRFLSTLNKLKATNNE